MDRATALWARPTTAARPATPGGSRNGVPSRGASARRSSRPCGVSRAASSCLRARPSLRIAAWRDTLSGPSSLSSVGPALGEAGDVRQVAILLLRVEAVANDEDVRDLAPEVVQGDVCGPLATLRDERAGLQRGRPARLEVAQEI